MPYSAHPVYTYETTSDPPPSSSTKLRLDPVWGERFDEGKRAAASCPPPPGPPAVVSSSFVVDVVILIDAVVSQ